MPKCPSKGVDSAPFIGVVMRLQKLTCRTHGWGGGGGGGWWWCGAARMEWRCGVAVAVAWLRLAVGVVVVGVVLFFVVGVVVGVVVVLLSCCFVVLFSCCLLFCLFVCLFVVVVARMTYTAIVTAAPAIAAAAPASLSKVDRFSFTITLKSRQLTRPS